MKYKLSDLLPIITETLESGGEFTLPVTGTSMLPLLREKRDSVQLARARVPLYIGDLPLYRRADGAFVLHRVVGKDENGYVMCGDNQFDLERNITDGMIVGVVVKINRDGRMFSVSTPLYRTYVRLWTRLLGVRYPLRRLRRSARKTDAPAVLSTQPKPCVSYLLALLRSALLESVPPDVPDDVDMADVLRLAKMHRVANTAAFAVMKLPSLDAAIKKEFQAELFKVVRRQEIQKEALKSIGERLTQAEIRFCALKGEALASLYPSPEMRYSLDIDVYVAPADVPAAEKLLLNMGYRQEGERTTKDIVFVKKPALTVELHFDLNFETDVTYAYFQKLPDRLVPSADNPYRLAMSGEDLLIYVIGHAAHHFLVAGTGIKSVLDDWLLREKLLPQCDAALIERELEAAGLTEFSRQLAALGGFWFKDGQDTETVRRMGKYIVESGVFGTSDAFYVNATVSQSKIGGSKVLYVLERIFPSYTVMTALFPSLKKAPVLLPFCWVARWGKVLLNFRRITGEIASVAAADQKIRRERSDLFGKLGFR